MKDRKVGFFCGNMEKLSLSNSRRTRGAYNGAENSFRLLQSLSNNFPNNKYYVLMRASDWKRYNKEDYLRDFPNKNVIFTVNNLLDREGDELLKDFYGDVMTDDFRKGITLLINEVEDLELDYFLSSGLIISATIPGVTRLKNIEKFARGRIQSNRLETVPLCVINHFKNIPYYAVNFDHRFMSSKESCLLNIPRLLFGLEERKYTFNNLKDLSYESYKDDNRIKKVVPMKYVSAHRIGVVGANDIDIDYSTKNELGLYINQHGASDFNRLEVIREYIFPLKNFKIYGNLKNQFKKSIPKVFRPQFYDRVSKEELMNNSLENDLFTFIIPSNKGITPSSDRFWESIYCGVIPFLHKNYGSEDFKKKHKIPKELYVNSPKDLKDKIEYYSNNKQEAINLSKRLRKMYFTEGIQTGRDLVEEINNYIEKDLI